MLSQHGVSSILCLFLYWRRGWKVRAMRSDWLDRCLLWRMSSRYITESNHPRGRVFSCLQCNMSTQNYVCCGHSALPTCAALAPAAAGLSAAASPLSSRISPPPRVKSCCVALLLVDPHFPPSSPAVCSPRSLGFSVGAGEVALGFTGRAVTSAVTTRKRPTGDALKPPRNDAASSPHLWKPDRQGAESAHLVFNHCL